MCFKRWRFFVLPLCADNVSTHNNIVFFRACTNSCVQYLWELPAKDTVRCSRLVYASVIAPQCLQALITVQGSVALYVAWLPKQAGGHSNQPSCPNDSAPTFSAFLIIKRSSLSLSTNVNFSQLARTRLVYYWFRGFACVAVCVCILSKPNVYGNVGAGIPTL